MALQARSSGGKGPTPRTSKPMTTKAVVAAKTNTEVSIRKPTIRGFEIPSEPSEPVYNLGGASIFVHGEEGIGKTSLLSQFPDPLFLMFEPGGKFLRIKRIPEQGQFDSWESFVKTVDNLVKSDSIQTVVIDTADLAYELAVSHVLKEAGEESINEGSLGYNKGNDKVARLFKNEVLRITATGRGVVFISHSQSKEFERGGGVKYQKIIPTATDRARRFLAGFCDLTGYYGYFGNDRYLVVEGNENLTAKQRIEGRFETPEGERLVAIPMGESSEEAYENFITAFNNKQTDTYSSLRKAELSEVKAKFTKKR